MTRSSLTDACDYSHGLSYGKQTLSGLKVTGRTISFSTAGTGCETPQIYIGYPTAAANPKVPVKVMRCKHHPQHPL